MHIFWPSEWKTTPSGHKWWRKLYTAAEHLSNCTFQYILTRTAWGGRECGPGGLKLKVVYPHWMIQTVWLATWGVFAKSTELAILSTSGSAFSPAQAVLVLLWMSRVSDDNWPPPACPEIARVRRKRIVTLWARVLKEFWTASCLHICLSNHIRSKIDCKKKYQLKKLISITP